MKIHTQQVLEVPFVFEFTFPSPKFTKLKDKIKIIENSFFCEGEITRNKDHFYIKGNYRLNFQAECDSCLITFNARKKAIVDLVLLPEEIFNVFGSSKQVSSSPNRQETDYYEKDVLLLTRYFEDQLILDMPFPLKCSEDCRGICICGANLNKESCRCNNLNINQPFANLKSIRNLK